MTTGTSLRPREDDTSKQGLGAMVFKDLHQPPLGGFWSTYSPEVAGGLVRPRYKSGSLLF